MERRRCRSCGRSEPEYIFDPHCAGPEVYCDFVESDQFEHHLPMPPVEKSEHQARHEALHSALDELVADWLLHNPGKRPTTSSVFDLMMWANEQRKSPTEVR